MRTTVKKEDNICIRLGYQTKHDLIALAQANELTMAEFVRQLIRQAINENQDVIMEQQMKGVKKDDSY